MSRHSGHLQERIRDAIYINIGQAKEPNEVTVGMKCESKWNLYFRLTFSMINNKIVIFCYAWRPWILFHTHRHTDEKKLYERHKIMNGETDFPLLFLLKKTKCPTSKHSCSSSPPHISHVLTTNCQEIIYSDSQWDAVCKEIKTWKHRPF